MRIFKQPSKDDLIAFAFHSTRIERIPVSSQQIDNTLSGGDPHPSLEGQLKCLNLILQLAPNPNLLPESSSCAYDSLNHLSFMKRLNLNLLKAECLHAEKFGQDYFPISKIGQWREERKFYHTLKGQIEAPSPFNISNLLHDWFSNLLEFHNSMKPKLDSPHLLTKDDITSLSKKAREANLKICCIKPFARGSNRTARLVENLLRLNWCLPLKTIRHEDEYKLPYIDEIENMRQNYLND